MIHSLRSFITRKPYRVSRSFERAALAARLQRLAAGEPDEYRAFRAHALSEAANWLSGGDHQAARDALDAAADYRGMGKV